MTLYSLILFIHIATASSLILLVLYGDHLAWGWMRGKYEVLSTKRLKKLHNFIYLGLAIMITSGIYMFWPVREYLLYTPAFQVKMSLVLSLIINSFFINKFMSLASAKSYNLLTKRERVPLFISGMVSTTAWVGVVIAATQLGL